MSKNWIMVMALHDNPAYNDRPIDQEAVAEFLQGTKDDYF